MSVLTEYQLDQLVEVAHKDCSWGGLSPAKVILAISPEMTMRGLSWWSSNWAEPRRHFGTPLGLDPDFRSQRTRTLGLTRDPPESQFPIPLLGWHRCILTLCSTQHSIYGHNLTHVFDSSCTWVAHKLCPLGGACRQKKWLVLTSICAENRRSFRPRRPKKSSAMFDLRPSQTPVSTFLPAHSLKH